MQFNDQVRVFSNLIHFSVNIDKPLYFLSLNIPYPFICHSILGVARGGGGYSHYGLTGGSSQDQSVPKLKR